MTLFHLAAGYILIALATSYFIFWCNVIYFERKVIGQEVAWGFVLGALWPVYWSAILVLVVWTWLQ